MNRHVNPEDPDLYALGALDGEEKQEFEAHVRACEACAQAVEAARRRVALLALAAPAAQLPRLARDRMLARLRMEGARSPQERYRRFVWLTPAFALGFFIATVAALTLYMDNQNYRRQVRDLQAQLTVAESRTLEVARASEATDKLLGMPGTVRVTLTPMPGMGNGRAGVLYNEKMGMVACAGWLPAPPKGKSYQLWLVPMEGKPMPLQVFGNGEWTEPMTMHVAPGMQAKAFAVTEEPAGGMPWPTGPKVLAGAGE